MGCDACEVAPESRQGLAEEGTAALAQPASPTVNTHPESND
jgi:hypothetical protein